MNSHVFYIINRGQRQKLWLLLWNATTFDGSAVFVNELQEILVERRFSSERFSSALRAWAVSRDSYAIVLYFSAL